MRIAKQSSSVRKKFRLMFLLSEVQMIEPTIIVLDLKNITGDPTLAVAKLDSTVTIKMLRKRLNFVLMWFGFPFGKIDFYQSKRKLLNFDRVINLPKGTVTCYLSCVKLPPIQELPSSNEQCFFCGQQFEKKQIFCCSQCNGY